MKNMEIKKKFSCTQCNYSTNYKHDLKRHSKAKHLDLLQKSMKKLNCENCKFSTNHKQNILRHNEVKHPVQRTKKSLKEKAKKCFCIPMFYTVQVLDHTLKKTPKFYTFQFLENSQRKNEEGKVEKS